MIIYPLRARRLQTACRRPNAEPLSPQQIAYLMMVIDTLSVALKTTAQPSCRWPKQPVTGWELASTAIYIKNVMRWQGGAIGHKIYCEEYVGSRSIYLKPSGGLRAVLTVPKPHQLGLHTTVAIVRTNVPRLLDEDPALYTALLTAVDKKIQYYELGYSRSPLT